MLSCFSRLFTQFVEDLRTIGRRGVETALILCLRAILCLRNK